MEHTKNSGGIPPASFIGAQQQHLANLHALLQTCIDHADFQTAASVAAVLLQAHDPSVGTGSKSEIHLTRAERDFDYLLLACGEVLKREPLPADQVRSCLCMMIQSHGSLYAAEITRLVVAMLLIEQGDLPQAAVLLEVNAQRTRGAHHSRAVFTFTRHALTGLIRHRQLLDIVLDAAVPLPSGRHSRAAAPSAPAPGAGGPSLVFTYDSHTWLKACNNRQLKEVWRECEKHLKEALALYPGYVLLTYALCHAYVVSGKISAALDAAQATCAAAPHDTDAQALLTLLRQVWKDHQDMLSAEGQDPACEHDTVMDMTRSLQLDGSCQPALMGLLSRCSHCSGCMLSAAIGCMHHLDVTSSPGADTALAPLAWACLAACLCGLAEEQLAPDTRDQEPGGPNSHPQLRPGVSPGETDDASPSPGPSGAPQPELMPDTDAAWPSSANGRWRKLIRELQLRGYWWEHTLLQLPSTPSPPLAHLGSAATQHPHPGTSDGAAAAAGSGPQARDRLVDAAHRAVVCCFMLRYDHDLVSHVRAELQPAVGASAGGAAAGQQGGGQAPRCRKLQEAAQLLEHAVGLATRQLLSRGTVALPREVQVQGTAPLPLVFPMVRRKRRLE